jgi:hypothetical protein
MYRQVFWLSQTATPSRLYNKQLPIAYSLLKKNSGTMLQLYKRITAAGTAPVFNRIPC